MEPDASAASQNPNKTSLTILRLWSYLWPRPKPEDNPGLPEWPPDVFALCAAVLKKSGVYTVILDPRQVRTVDQDVSLERIREETHAKIRKREERVRKAGEAWRQKLGLPAPDRLPQDVQTAWEGVSQLWDTIFSKINYEVSGLINRPEVCIALIDLLAISDEACRGLGLPSTNPLPAKLNIKERERQVAERAFYAEAERKLFPRQFGSTLCKNIHPSIARVLPKMHTAQCGLTIRSFSHHLAFCESDEVRPSWFSVPGSIGNSEDIYRMNILIAPYPLKLEPAQISEVKQEVLPYRSFDVDVKDTNGGVAEDVVALATAAEACVGQIDAVIMPEMAITTRDYRLLRTALLRKGILSIAGVSARKRASNYLAIDVPISKHFAVHLRQRKHHRWKLDESQIKQYHLGSRLRTDKRYWEHIDVQDRQLRFIVLRPWLVTTTLICEDLARHDPVGDLIKGVGPNLVIALLMDGPQITNRWSSRYAAALADDPGCSVLSITSLGMAGLSRPPNDDGRSSRVIGLWKDAFSGAATEIAVKPGDHGVVITVMMRTRTEKTADFRSDEGVASYPTISGVHSIKLPDKSPSIENALQSPGWLSIAEACELASLAQRPSMSLRPSAAKQEKAREPSDAMQAGFMPKGLEKLQGSAFRIGREIWRIKTAGKKPECGKDEPWATHEEEEAAEEIVRWDKTNREFHT